MKVEVDIPYRSVKKLREIADSLNVVGFTDTPDEKSAIEFIVRNALSNNQNGIAKIHALCRRYLMQPKTTKMSHKADTREIKQSFKKTLNQTIKHGEINQSTERAKGS